MKEAGSSAGQRGFGGAILSGTSNVLLETSDALNSEGYQCVLQQFQSGSRVRVRSKELISCVTTALVSRQKCDGQVKDAIDKMPSHMPARPGPRPSKTFAGIDRRTNTFATRCAKWQASAARRTRVQQCGSVGWNRSLEEHACNSAQSGRHPSGGRKWRRRK